MLALKSYEQANGFSVMDADELFFINGGSSTTTTTKEFKNITDVETKNTKTHVETYKTTTTTTTTD